MQWARAAFCCLVCRVEVQPLRRWDFSVALQEARRRVASAAGVSVREVEVAEGGYVDRARKGYEIMAPALVRLQMALTLGTSPEELDQVRGGARLMLESIKQSLAVVGLRAGEEVSVDISERMQGFLTRWQERRELSGAGQEPADSHLPVVIEGEARRIA